MLRIAYPLAHFISKHDLLPTSSLLLPTWLKVSLKTQGLNNYKRTNNREVGVKPKWRISIKGFCFTKARQTPYSLTFGTRRTMRKAIFRGLL